MRQLFVKTDKAFITDLPRFTFEGKIVIVQSEKEAIRAVEVLSRNKIVGFDTETRPSFHKGVVHKVALLQISTLELCFLFRLNMIGLPACVIDFLSNPQILKVGLSLKDDWAALRHRQQFVPANYVDLQNLAAEMGIQDMSLQKLYANIFRKRISKNARLSNWEADVLTDAQKVYAATDAYTSLQLYEEMTALKESGEFTWITPSTEKPLPSPEKIDTTNKI